MTTNTAVAAGDDKPRRNPRRVNGEGNIRQRPDGRWEGRAWVFTTDGREVRRSVYGASWDEAHEALTKLQVDRMMGRRVATSQKNVGEWLDFWLTELVRPRVRDTTYNSYADMIARHLVPALGRKKLTRLQAVDIRKAYARLRQVCQCCAHGRDQAREERAEAERKKREGRPPRKNARVITGARCCALKPPTCCGAVLSEGTVRYLHRILRAALEDAVIEGVLAENVAKNLGRVKAYKPKFVPWTGDEAQQFLTAIRDDRHYALYAVALSLGLRRGEALGLRWQDVDLGNGVIRVRNALQRVNGALRLGPVKTDGSIRAIEVPSPCLRALRAHAAQQHEDERIAGKAWQAGQYVFASKLGTPLEPRNVNRHFAAMCDRAGVRRIRFHDLRHSCATLLYQQGVSIENIQDVLGHSSPIITKTIYVDVADQVQRGALDRLDHLFAQEG